MDSVRGLAKLGYWLYLGFGSLVMLVVTLIAASWGLAVVFGFVLALSIRRLNTLRRAADG